MTAKYNWQEYWSGKLDGGHKFSDEHWLEREYNEKSRFFGTDNEVLVDVGCGSAELLSYYGQNARQCYGVDFSDSMIAEAKNRLALKKINNIRLICTNAGDMWPKLPDNIDIITCCGVIQYFTGEMTEDFIKNSLAKLSDKGKIILFDIIDTRYKYLWRYGIYRRNVTSSLDMFCLAAYSLYADIKHLLIKNTVKEMGNSYTPADFWQLSEKLNLNCFISESRFYPYRFHVVLSRK